MLAFKPKQNVAFGTKLETAETARNESVVEAESDPITSK